MVGSTVYFNLTLFLSILLLSNMKSDGLFELMPFALFLEIQLCVLVVFPSLYTHTVYFFNDIF